MLPTSSMCTGVLQTFSLLTQLWQSLIVTCIVVYLPIDTNIVDLFLIEPNDADYFSIVTIMLNISPMTKTLQTFFFIATNIAEYFPVDAKVADLFLINISVANNLKARQKLYEKLFIMKIRAISFSGVIAILRFFKL